jgi:hypothetical protein
MTATPLLDKCRNDCRLCWFSADSLNTRVDAFNFVVVKTKTLKISAHQTPAARSRPNSKFANGAKRTSWPPHFITCTPEHAAKSP